MFKLRTPLGKTVSGALAVATVAGALVASSASADARPWHRGYRGGIGPGIAAGVIGGLALGALAARPYYNSPGYAGYGRCWIERQEVADRWGRPMWRDVRVCG